MAGFYLIDNRLELPELQFGKLRKYDKYSLKWLNGALCIVGHGNTASSSFESNDYDKLLVDTLSLVKEPRGHNWDWGIKMFDKDRLFKWLKRYGLPVAHDIPSSIVEELNEPHSSGSLIYYPMQDFANHAGALYLIYKLHESIYDKSENEIARYMLFLHSHPLVRFSPERGREKTLELIEAQYASMSLEDKIQRGYNLIGQRLDVELNSMKLGFDHSQQLFYIEAFSLFDLCYYRLAVLIAQSKSEGKPTYRNHIKRCDYCKRIFWGHGNRDYCSFCPRSTVFSRRHLNKSGRETP
jgi:hypothetical protein